MCNEVNSSEGFVEQNTYGTAFSITGIELVSETTEEELNRAEGPAPDLVAGGTISLHQTC